MMYNLKNTFNKVTKQKITYLALVNILLVVGIMLTVSVSHVANAAAPSITITFTDTDGDASDTDDETTKTREKTATATDSANVSGTRWKHKRIASNVDCDATAMSAGTRTGNRIRMGSETYNTYKICFEAANGGNVGYEVTAVIEGIDRTRPDAPTTIALDESDDSGVSNTDGLTSTTTGLTITGCAETDSEVELLLDGRSFVPAQKEVANSNTCTVDGTSQFSFDINLAERLRKYVISAKTTDTAGNESTTSSSRENKDIVIDTTAPTVALTHRLTGGIAGEKDDSGITYLNADDTIAVTMTFTEANGMSEDASAQPIVSFFNNNTALNGATEITGSSNVKTATYTISETDTIANNNLKYDITNEELVTDKAGNQLTTQSVKTISNTVVDTTKPTVTSIDFETSNEDNAWAVESDEITTTIVFSEKISEKTSNTNILYRIGTRGASQRFSFTAGRNISSGQCQETETANEYKCTYTVKEGDAGIFQVSVDKFADYAGNAGDKGDFEGTITTDTGVTAPSAITLKRGIEERDKEITPTFIVTVGESGGEVILYSNNDCSTEISEATSVTDTTRPFTIEVQTNDYEDDGSDDGVKTIYATHEDDAGNISDCSTAYGSYTLDTSAPTVDEVATGYYSDAATTRKIPLVDGKGKVAAGNSIYTKVAFDEEVKYRPGSSERALPAIKYTIGETEYSYRIVSNASTLSGGRCKPTNANNISDTYICQYRVRSNDVGNFTLVVDEQTEDLLEQTLEERYTHADSITLDNTAPAKPSALELETADDSGNITDDNITNKTTNLTIEGCAEEDSTVQLYANGNSIANATDIADDSGYSCTDSGNDGFSIDISLTEGTHRITAKATDESSNVGPASDALTIIVDTTAPTATLTNAPSNTNNVDTLDVTVGGTDVTHYQYAMFTGNSCANANYLDSDTGGTIIANKVTASTPNQDGSIILCVVGRDKAGNWQTKADATTATWTRDKTGPAKPTGLTLDAADDTGLLATDGITKNTTGLTITGCAEEDSTVEILKNGASFSTKVTDIADTTDAACTQGTKKFSADISLTEGDRSYTISAIATDQTSNASNRSDALIIEIKTTAPSITATNLDLATNDDSGVDNDDITNQKTGLTISGTLSGTPSTNDYVQLYDGTKILAGARDSSFTGQNNDWSVDIDLSTEGVHTINAKVLDAAGNEGGATSITITIDTTGPTVSVTKHITSPTTDITPDIKIRTSATGTVSFGGACTDASESPTTQTVVAGENTVTLPTLENRAYNDCTVMVRDETGNLSTGTKINPFIVDNTPPTITGAAANNATRTKTKITLNEQVYAPNTPSANDFQIEIDGTTYADLVTGISGIAKTKETASQSFTLTHSALPEGNVSIKYTKGINHIFDQIGNTLESSSTSIAISTTQFVSIALHADDDTGFDNTDGITQFNGNEVTLTVSLNTGTFTNGDRVRIFVGNDNTATASYTISDTIVGSRYIDANGERSFSSTLAKNIFKVGVNNLSATYTKTGSVEGDRGEIATITYDNTAPVINIQNPNTNPALQKEVRATDNEAGTTTWKYKTLTESIQVCGTATMNAGTIDYTEGNAIIFESTDDNGNRICFSTTDAAGNTAYLASTKLNGIDNSTPTVESVVTTSVDRRTARVTLSERVYATSTPTPNDFKVVVGNTEYPIIGITELANSISTAKNTFIITLPTVPGNTEMFLKYTAGTNKITDVIGNQLASFDGQKVDNMKLISLDLDATDDTGSDTTDNITRFDGDTVTLTVSLNEGVFNNGDTIRLFIGNNVAQTYTISNLLTGSNYKNATGKTSFSADLPKRAFSRGLNNLSATHTQSGGNESARGGTLAITYDNTAPVINIQNPNTNPALQKEVRATDNEAGTTTWKYKILTETVQVCNAATMNVGTTDYTEGNPIVLKDADDNGSRICFSTTDAAGNTAYLASTTISGIDNSTPTVESAVTTSIDRRTARVTISEPVYAKVAPTPNDFKVVVGNTEYPIIGITELASSISTAKNTFIITLPSVPTNTQMVLKYTAGTNKIIDVVGNQLASFDEQAINNMKLISLDLDATDDTGSDRTDNITRFDGDTVTLTVSLNEGIFNNGDIVRLFIGSNVAQTYTISNLITGPTYKNATGNASFTADLQKHIFSRGLNNLSATHMQSGGNESVRGSTLAITYDITGAQITVQNPTSRKEQQKTISATDTDSTTTVWQYKQIAGTIACDANTMTDAKTYSEGATTIVFSSESDNGTKVCFSSTDIAGNTTYLASNQVSNIDTTAPTVSGVSTTTTTRTTTKVSFDEPVYANTNISPNDFRIVSGQTQYIVTGITGLGNNEDTAETSLTLTHVPLGETETVNLQYTKGNANITDIAGNTLQNFTKAVANRPFATLTLSPQDDTGTSKTDGITHFDGDEASFTISLKSGTFTNGDQIRIHEKGEASILKRVIVASAGTNTVNANGTASFTTTIAKRLFTEGEITLYTTYTPAGQITATNGIDFSFIYDTTAPRISITNPTTEIATKKQVSAVDSETSTTTWMYKMIEQDTICDASALSNNTTPYNEGDTLDIISNDANGKKVCFSSTDIAGNSTHVASTTLQGIDNVAPTISSAVIENYERTKTVIIFDEKIYASNDFSPSDFSIEIGDTGYSHRVSDIENLPTASNRAIETLTLIHPAISDEIESRIAYTPETGTIQDITGNTLKEFTKVIENTSFITLDLSDEDDTGSSENDNYTKLEGSTATLIVKLTNNAVFSNSDIITIYKEHDNRTTRTTVKRITISTFPAQNTVNAQGNNSFTTEIPNSFFDENATTTLSAGHAPFGNTRLNKIGGALQVTVDIVAPTITITEASGDISAQKSVSATGEDTTETVWKYAQIQSGVVCDANAIENGKEYTKGTAITLDNENYNNTKICFSVTDLAGNTTYKSSEIITGIDTEAPTVKSISVTGEDELTVTMSEPIYAIRNPNPDDFVVFVNDSPVTTATIIGIPNHARNAEDEFIIVIADTIRADDIISLSYIGSSRSNNNELIKDVIGNTLTTFDKITATLPSVLTIKLDPADDTGTNNADGITKFDDDSEVKFIVTLSKDTFKDGDRVRIYKNNENRPISSTTVGIRGNEVNVRGETSLTVAIAKRVFTEGSLTLYATYRPRLEAEGLPSALLSITYDTTAPNITITAPTDNPEREKAVSATDTDTAETIWTYKQVAENASCDIAQMADGAESYTEGTDIIFNKEDDNNTRVCFSVSDIAGNTSHALSRTLKEIDTTGSVITVTNPANTPAKSKTIKAIDNDDTATNWKYKQIAEDAVCNAGEMSNNTQPYTEGRSITFNEESDNGTKVCFSVTDTIGNTSYETSAILSNIDNTPPAITITNPTDNPEREKVVSATDTDTAETIWTYKQIASNANCDAGQMTTGTKSYTEGTSITFNKKSDNGTKVCFFVFDKADNFTYQESATLSGIDQAGPVITINNPTDNPEQEKVVSATDADTTETTWAYKQIASGASCDAGQMASGTQRYTEGTDITLNEESDNSTKICFSATDTIGNTSYEESLIVEGIDTTPPSITVHNPNTENSASKIIRAEDTDTDITIWGYAQVNADVACEEAINPSQTSPSPYTEGTSITFNKKSDNGTKVCFFVFDKADNFTYQESATLSGIDQAGPVITINNPTDNPEQEKVVSATDADTTETTWAYKQIASGASCDAGQMARDTQSYTEGDVINLDDEGDNGTKICFSSTDRIGNTSYEASTAISNIDTTAPIIAITSSNNNPEMEKMVEADDTDNTETIWTYKQITSSAKCDTAQMISGTQQYTEGTKITFNKEDDNGTKICFSATDSAGNTGYERSAVIRNIDTTAPSITITNPDVNIVLTSKKVSASDNEEDSQWTYQQISEDASCNISTAYAVCTDDAMQCPDGSAVGRVGPDCAFAPCPGEGKLLVATTHYTEGTDLIFDKESDNNTKICFMATDVAGNIATQSSVTLMNIKERATAITTTTTIWTDFDKLTDDTVPQAQAKAVVGMNASDAPSTWFYKQIDGDAVCNAAVQNAGDVNPYTEGEPIILREESDNGTKICFISIDQDGKITATASEIITGIDTTIPTIIITNPDTDSAQEKVVTAYDYDNSETSWQYKQVAFEMTCDSNAFTATAQEYTENTPLRFTKESDNNTKVCFSVTDSAGNTSYATSDVLTGIDTTAPTISSAKLIDVNRTQTEITVNEHIYAHGTVSPSNFKIEIEGVSYPATKISGFERSASTEETIFTITHPAIVSEATATLSYTEGSVAIVDVAGNALQNLTRQPLSDKAFVALSLATIDDTGLSTNDGITNFVNDEITLIATISEETFSNGDVIEVYKKGAARSLKKVLISGGLVDAINAHGESSFEIVVPKSTFTANKETILYTVYTPADGSNSDGQKGLEFTISYRTTAPQITVITSDVSAATATIRATDENKVNETVWHYIQIKGDEECLADTLTQEAHAYTEGTEISFTDETANNTKVCFSSADIAGNTAYATSDVITIDLTAPSITVQPLASTSERAKIVRASDNDEGETTWKYRVLKAEEVCDGKALSETTRPYKEGSGLKFNKEEANGHKVCFSSTDTAGNVLYAESMIIQGIDANAPHITITMEGEEEKIVRARDTDTAGSTSWKYRVIKANESCTAEMIQESSRTYREGSGLVFRNSRANGYKVCFAATDNAGNVSYRTSNTMQGIGKTSTGLPSSSLPSSSALQDANRPTNTASPLAPLSNPLYPITRTP